jgi:SAM-dependent methyltransferase
VTDPTTDSAFRLQCPICSSEVTRLDGSGLCQLNAHRFSRSKGIWRFLPLAREVHYRQFLKEYRTVRQAEKWGAANSEYYRELPRVRRDDARREIWHIRERNFRALVSWIGRGRPLRILDAGAGNCWLSYQLSLRGHTVAALDLSDETLDGLGARANYGMELQCFQAEFDRVPFSPAQFDLVVFNAAFHYSEEPNSTLLESKRVLTQGGKILVLDSPFYLDEVSGVAAVELREANFTDEFGFSRDLKNVGFLTQVRLEMAASATGLKLQILSIAEAWDERLRRAWNRRRKGREPALFPLIVFEL